MLPSFRAAVVAMALITALGSLPTSAQRRGAFGGPRGGAAFVGPRGGAFIGPRGNAFVRPGFNLRRGLSVLWLPLWLPLPLCVSVPLSGAIPVLPAVLRTKS